jgi:hypothetical protein
MKLDRLEGFVQLPLCLTPATDGAGCRLKVQAPEGLEVRLSLLAFMVHDFLCGAAGVGGG